LIEPAKPRHVKGLTDEQVALIERESVNLGRDFTIVERAYRTDHLDAVLSGGYVARLPDDPRWRAISPA
jgi:hypothetical protein